MPELNPAPQRRRNKSSAALFAACVAAGALLASNFAAPTRAEAPAAPPQRPAINAITQPSERHKLSFPAAGLIKTELVKEGDAVKAGQILLAQDDELEKDEMEKARVEAESTAKLDAAVADYNAKKHIYEGKLTILNKGAANQQEVEDARLDMILRDKQILVAKDEQTQAKIKFAQEQKKVQDMHLASPVDGYVERITVQSGEMADPQKPEGACWVVKNNPLFIEIRDLSSRQVSHLRLGDKLQVKYPDESDWQTATLTFRSPVVDAASDTQMVKLTLDNVKDRDAGLQIQVQLPPAMTEVGNAADKAADKTAAAAP